MKKERRKRARLMALEDHAWVFAFYFHLDTGLTDLQADRSAWKDLCLEFPRLRKYDSCRP